MAGQTEFLQAIQELERLGETNGNQLFYGRNQFLFF